MKKDLSNQELLDLIQFKLEENERTLAAERALSQELNEVNEKLLDSEHLKSNFLSNIRNEINNPLSAILEFSKTIAEGKLPAESIAKYAHLIYLEAFDLDFQLRNIFLSAEIEAGESPVHISNIQVNGFVQGIVDLFSAKAQKKEVTLKVSTPLNDQQHIHSDSEKLSLILGNLLVNAIVFNQKGGQVELLLSMKEEQLFIEVKDNGIGIAPAHQDKIFDRFYQVEQGSTKTYQGHGLGLSITKALVELLGGSITVESELGKGSSFCISLKNLNSNESESSYSPDSNEFLFDEQDEDDMLF